MKNELNTANNLSVFDVFRERIISIGGTVKKHKKTVVVTGPGQPGQRNVFEIVGTNIESIGQPTIRRCTKTACYQWIVDQIELS